MNFCISFISYSLKVGKTCMSTNRSMDKQIVVCLYSGNLLISKKDQIANTCYNTIESQKF